MVLPEPVRSLIFLIVGLGVGVVGATLFIQSMPGSEGSPEERASKLETELKRAQNRIAALEAAANLPQPTPHGLLERIAGGRNSHDRKDGLLDDARRIAEDIREGRPVSPDDIFRATQPLIRDLAPLFDRMRLKQQQAVIDSMTGELARKYNLTPQNQQLLKGWFADKANEQARQWSELIGRDGTRLEDVVRASQNVRLDDGLETFMGNILPSDKLAGFKTERLNERAARVEHEADMKVQQLDGVVGLDQTQRDQAFAIMARGSRDYDPAMSIEGASGQVNVTPGGDRQTAILSVLRPDQRAAYETERQRRRDEAAKNMEAMGLKLPTNWEMFDDGNFR